MGGCPAWEVEPREVISHGSTSPLTDKCSLPLKSELLAQLLVKATVKATANS